MFDEHLERWQLVADGEEIVTSTARLLPVRSGGQPAMLKVFSKAEKRGVELLDWWDGGGVARVLVRNDQALLMERAMSDRSLVELVHRGEDDEASRIACAVLAKLHAPRRQSLPVLTPLSEWFKPLAAMARVHGGVLNLAAETAAGLLGSPEEAVPLHGDIHHANILDFGSRGWLAIDPKGLLGERYFDYTNLFCNPDFEVAMLPGRFQRQIDLVASVAGLERRRLLEWVLAWSGLSLAFEWEDGNPTQKAFALLEMVAREIDR